MGTSLPCSIHLPTMKTFLYISTLLTASTAAPQYGHAVHAVAPVHAVAHHTGYANPDLSEVSPYTYNYGVADEYSGAAFSQQESNDGTGVVGVLIRSTFLTVVFRLLTTTPTTTM